MATRSEQFLEQQKRDEITQHAKKIDQGFRRLGDVDSKRAIWELFQNALDLSEGDCNISIEVEPDKLIFNHNGKVFTPRDLTSLNKQYSLKNIEHNSDGVGQYGTGFISTHSFGKSLKITSSLEFGGEFTELNKFPLDRSYESLEELERKILDQEDLIKQILDEKPFFSTPPIKNTSFLYYSIFPKENTSAKEALKQVQELVPYVFAFCDKLNSVTLNSFEDNFNELRYFRTPEKDDLVTESESIEKFQPYECNLTCNGEPLTIKYLGQINEDGEFRFKAILPIKNDNVLEPLQEYFPRVYLFYPLIGSHDFGFNFIFHSKDFSVNEKRSALELKSDNPKLEKEEEANRLLLDSISETIFDFLEDSIESLENPIEIATINFKTAGDDDLINKYFADLKKTWVEKFLEYKVVDTPLGRRTPNETIFIDRDLIEDNLNFPDLYALISKLEWEKPIPNKDIAERWTDIVDQWKTESIDYLTLDRLLLRIQEKTLAELPENELLSFYSFIISKGWSDRFEAYKLLPNYNKELCFQVNLNKGVNLHENYFTSISAIIPDVLSKLVKPEFIFSLKFKEYNRQKLYSDFKSEFESYFIIDKKEEKDTQSDDEKIVELESRIKNVAQLCNIQTAYGAENHRSKMIKKLDKKYGFNTEEIIIPNFDEDKFDYDSTPFSTLIRLVAEDMKEKTNLIESTNNEHLEFIQDLISEINKIGQHKSLLENLEIFPNQLGRLCKAISVAKEKDFFEKDIEDETFNFESENEFLKNKYLEVIGKDIREKLVNNFFKNSFEALKTEKEAKSVAGEMEDVFIKEKLDEIQNHGQRAIIFQIINKMTDENSKWPSLFPILESKKEIILMSKMTNKETKNDLFKIISLDDPKQINLLSSLAGKENLAEIVRKGEQQMQNEKDAADDFEFKKMLGLHIEGLIREKLDIELHNIRFGHPEFNKSDEESSAEPDSINAANIQNGQDIVIFKNGNIKYFVEVKSRWNTNSSIRMSTRQIQRAATEEKRFALCTVDMSNYHPSEGNRYFVENIELISDIIRFVSDIGSYLEPLVHAAMENDKLEENVKLVEYRSVIPKKLIDEKGITLDTFIDELVIILKNDS